VPGNDIERGSSRGAAAALRKALLGSDGKRGNIVLVHVNSGTLVLRGTLSKITTRRNTHEDH